MPSTIASEQKLLSPEEIAVRAGEQLRFLHLPEAGLFAERALRLRQLADGHAMADFLHFAATLADAQHRLLAGGGELPLPAPAVIEAAAQAGQPLFAAERWTRDGRWREQLRALLQQLAPSLGPGTARDTALRLAAADDAWLEQQAGKLLGGVMFGLDLATAPLIAAGLQLHFTQLVRQTEAAHRSDRLAPFGRIDDATRCPCCGSRPVAAVQRLGADGARYLACGLCGTQWHYVRVKCTHCQGTKGISLQNLLARDRDTDAPPPAPVVEAECCSECGHYLKLMHPARDAHVEPLADDLASLTLDLLLSEQDLQRHGLNLLLLFGDPDPPPPQ